GNVGIGTTGPENMLHIAKSNAGGIGASIYLDNPSASTLLNENQIAFGGDSGASFAGVSGARLRAITRNASSGATSFQIDTWDGAAEAARLYIKEDGNVGIGTTGPGALLHVQKAADTTSLEALRLDNPDPNQRSSTSVYMSMFAGAERARILAGNPNDFSSGEGFLAFYTRTSSALQERMRISNTGNVGIGTTDPSAQKLVVAGNVRVGTGTTGCVEDADGTVIAGTCSSDLRLKKDIVSLSGADMLGKFTALNPVSYTWRADEYPEKQLGTEIQYGLIAQEVEALFPELVKTDDKGFKQINFSVLPIYSIQAVKELNLNLNATAGTITPLAGSAQESFATSFFSNLFTKITAWLSDAGNGIAKIFAKEVHTDLICVSDENGKTCITRQDLVDMLTANGQNSNSDTTTTETTDTTTDTTTEETTTEDTSTTDTTDTTTDTTDTSTTEDTTTTEETTTETTDTTTDTSTTDTTTSEPTPAE
ncbi:MAG: tail fiber domain-containing protein, partial [Candidatus Paceibacterota bacterium]